MGRVWMEEKREEEDWEEVGGLAGTGTGALSLSGVVLPMVP